jgi:DNA primase
VALKKAGASYKGCCPFHEEKTPSFNVLPSRGMFHCFGCGVGGSVIDFVMKQERLEFIEALEKLAKEIGLEVPRGGTRKDPTEVEAEVRQRQAVQSANEAALIWFRENLLKGRNPLATEYLPKRGITDELGEKFHLGAALDGWDGLKLHLTAKGYSEQLLVEGGLCARSEKGRVYDRFRNRLMFPIFDTNGKIAGFGGRQLGSEEDGAKYLNSAETILYKKSKILYALNVARPFIEKVGNAILCEGYMDVIMAHAHGFTQAVASLGTALTPDQSRLLKRFANRTYFLYDGDEAGQKAMLRGGDSLLTAGFDVRVVSLPEKDDPDTYLQREGAEALKKEMEHAREYYDFALLAHCKDLDLNTLAGQAEAVERMAPIILSMKNEVMREGAITRLLKKVSGIPRDAIEHILNNKQKKIDERGQWGQRRDEEHRGENQSDSVITPSAPDLDRLERNLLKIMLESPEALALIRLKLHDDWVKDQRLAPWIFHFFDHVELVSTLINEMEASGEFPGDRTILNGILAWEQFLGSPIEAADQLIWRLHERYKLVLTRKMLSMIDEKIVRGEAADRILMAYHHEHTLRIKETGRFLRTKDASTRSGRVRKLK